MRPPLKRLTQARSLNFHTGLKHFSHISVEPTFGQLVYLFGLESTTPRLSSAAAAAPPSGGYLSNQMWGVTLAAEDRNTESLAISGLLSRLVLNKRMSSYSRFTLEGLHSARWGGAFSPVARSACVATSPIG